MKVLLALLCLVLTVSGQQFNTYFRPSYPMVRSFVRYRGIPSTHSFTIVPQTQRVISSYRPLKHRTIPRINPITQHMIVPTTTTFSQRGFVPTALLPGLAPMPSGISKSAALSVRALPPDESHRGWRVAIPARLPGPTYTPLGFVSTNGQVIESSTSDMTGTGQDILTKSTGINGNGQETLTTSGVDGLITQDIVYPSQRESESITIAREEMTGQNEGYVTTDDTSVGQTASKKPTEYKTKTSTSKRRRQLELKLKRLRAAKAAKRAARKAAMKAAKKAEKKIIKTTTSYVRKSAPATSLRQSKITETSAMKSQRRNVKSKGFGINLTPQVHANLMQLGNSYGLEDTVTKSIIDDLIKSMEGGNLKFRGHRMSPERQAALRQLQEKSLQLLASLAAESATSSTPTHSHTRGVGRPGGVQTINIHMKSGHVPGHQNIGRGAVDAQILSILKQIEQSGGYTHSHGSAGMNYEELTALLRQLQPLQERTLQEVSSGGGLVGNGDDILKQRIIQTTANTGRAIGPDLDSGTNGAGGSDITEFFKTLKQTSVSGENHGVGITQGFTQTGGVGSTAELAALLQQLEQSGIGQSGGPNSNSELASLLNRVGHSGLVSGQGSFEDRSHMATLLKQILESQRNKQGGPKAAHAIWELKTLITYLEKKKQKAGKKSLQPVNINTHIINSGNTGLIDEHTGSPEGMQNIAEVLRQIQASQTGPDSDVEALQGNVWISSSTSSTSHSGGQGQVPAGADMALLALTSGDSGMSGVSGSTTEQKLTTLIQELSKSANGPASEAELAMLVQRLAELQTGSQTGSKGGSQAITEQYSRTRQSGRPGFHRGIDGSFLRIMKTSSSSTTSSRNSSPKISNSISHSSGRNTHAAANHGRSHVSSSRSSSKISKSSESLKADRSFGGSSHKSSRNSSKSTKSYKKNNSSEKQSSSSKQSRQSKKQQLINKMKAQGSTQKEQYILLFNEGKTKRVSLTDLRKKLRPLVMSKGEYTTEEGISKGINEIVQKLRIESQRRMETGSGDTDTFVINGMHIEYDHPARAGSTGLSPRGVARGGPIDPATISNFSPSQVLKNTLAALVGQRSVTPESPATGNSLTETGTQNQFLDSFFSMPQEQGGQTADMSAAQAFRIAAASSLLGQIPPSVDTHTSPNKMGTGSTTSTTVISSSGTQNNPPGTTGGSNTKHVSITSQTTSSTGSPANTVYHQTGSSPAKQPAVMIPDQTSATQLATESQYGPGAPVEATLSGVKSNTAHQASDLINFIIANEAAHQNTAVVNSLNQDVKGAGVNTVPMKSDIMASVLADQVAAENARNNMLASTITDIITSDPAVTSNSQSGTNGGSLYQPEGNILAAGANQNTVKLAQNIDITGMGASAMDPPTNSQKMQDFNLAVSSAYGQVPQGVKTGLPEPPAKSLLRMPGKPSDTGLQTPETQIASSGSTPSSSQNSGFLQSEPLANSAFSFPMIETAGGTKEATSPVTVTGSLVLQNDMMISLAELSGKLINSPPVTTDKPAKNIGTADICVTPDCIRAANQIKASRDLTMSSCEDFYQYTCGGWLSRSQIRPDQSSRSVKWDLQEKVDYKLHELLNQSAQFHHTPAEQKAIEFYKSCLNEGSIETLGLDVIRPLAEDIGGWPILDPNWSSRHYQLETMLAAARKYNVDTPIISLSVESDPSLPEKHIIHIEQPHLGLPDRNLFLTENKAYAAYVTYMLEVFKAFGANQSTVSNDVKDMVVFETQLAKLTQNVEEHHDHSQDQRLTIDQLQHMFPGLDWKQYIYNIFNMDQVRITIHSNDVVLLSNAEYFRNVFSLLQNTSARAEANYINWMLLQDLIMTLPAKIRQLHQTFTQALPDATPESPRWQQCVDETNKAFSLAVARLFVDQHFDTASKLEVQDMFAKTKSSMRNILQRETWMDLATRTFALEKLNSLQARVGYPEEIKNNTYLNNRYHSYIMDQNMYFQNTLNSVKAEAASTLRDLVTPSNELEWETPAPTAGDVFYDLDHNVIVLPAAVLQSPLFHKNYPRYLNYGAIGFIIGHKITHAFDDIGSKYSETGEFRDWWSNVTRTAYQQKAACFFKQYNGLTVSDALAAATVPADSKINGELTLKENIADNGGFMESFAAYTQWAKQKGLEHKLPGINLKPEQLFFVNYGRTWCGKTTPQEAVRRIKSDIFADAQNRVNVVMQNTPSFAETFSCPVGSPMNPVKKCALW